MRRFLKFLQYKVFSNNFHNKKKKDTKGAWLVLKINFYLARYIEDQPILFGNERWSYGAGF